MASKASVPLKGAKLRVIGAGLPRTGTTSFTEALRTILNGPVYHGGTQVTQGPPEDILSWTKMMHLQPSADKKDRDAIKAMLRERLDGFVACTDSPMCGFFPELVELYPDAMVVVTTRDPTSWTKSMHTVASAATMWFLGAVLLPLPTMRHFAGYINGLRVQYRHLYDEGEPLTEKTYHHHIEWLKRVVPPERLVFFDVKDGWDPLCKALGEPVPDVPFPKLNDGEAIQRLSERMVLEGLRRWAVIIGGFALAVVAGWWVKR
ncbi:P-loop containing nucleoside triphosphate hydrolase protein [Stachybotrys elegans]|uniref:P-loop containing nucleoside triphosphate hydrolase protein n=1 Tax=Stachybotrys elegans TaxID=80388 RepID=A0A8K0WM75_9HYPO|nr:P-loop containing nucleoside triphosphate hydrolase protein [Stachybotrys elegans]